MSKPHRIIRFVSAVLLLSALMPLRSSMGDTLTIDTAVSLGLGKHPDFRFARGGLNVARGDFWRTVSPASPIASIENEQVPRGLGISNYGEQRIGIGQSLEFPVVTIFRARAMALAAQSAESNTELAKAASRSEIRMTFVRAWLSGLRAVAADSLANAAELLARSGEKREAVGEITSLEKDRLTVQKEQFAREHAAAQLRLRVAVTQLEQLIGTQLEPGIVLAKPALEELANPENADLEDESAFVKRAVLLGESSRSWLTAEKLAWLPRIEVRIFRQLASNEKFWGGELGFSLPVWYMLGERGDIQKARGESEKALASSESARREWATRWTEASLSLDAALNTLGNFEGSALPVSRRALRAAIRSYEVGEVGITDLLSSFIQEQGVELGYLDAIENAWHWRTQLDILTAGYQKK
ncbi:MAG: TolC family protein [Candidatus Eisenbacteria bacterium]|nr:TolC family protein [Candidatus Eisenbacteria bacterium]